jgi:hypothetical protein
METMHISNKKTIRKDPLIGIIYGTICKLRQSMFLMPEIASPPPATGEIESGSYSNSFLLVQRNCRPNSKPR